MPHFGPFAQGIMVANCAWLLFFLVHRAEHVCMPKGKVYMQNEDGSKTFYQGPRAVIKRYLGKGF